MTKLEQAARQALDALEAGSDVAPIFWGETVDALRAALAQQQAEPVVVQKLEKLSPDDNLGNPSY